ncbi:MAG: protein-glutamate O-methyltransferase CheR [Bryobacteraceae bacterium]
MQILEDAPCRPLQTREFDKIRKLAYDTFGLDLRTGKETLVSARLGKYIRKSGFRSFDEYYQSVLEDKTGESLGNLIDALTTNHTSFFREPAHFEFLRRTYVPEWKKRGNLGIWSAACSSGEEPYSIAMCLLQELGTSPSTRFHILATDISRRVLAAAQRGIYQAERLEGLSRELMRAYWLRGEGEWAGCYRAKKEMRDLIEFRRLNLMEPVHRVGRFSLIFCRNVMIYFDKPTQQRVVERLVSCLEPGGFLLTGHAESLTGVEHNLRYVQPAVYRKVSSENVEQAKWRA